MAKRYYIKTFGCQMNEHDTEKIKGILSYYGFEEVEDEKVADIIILNTCAVREKPTHKVYSEAGRFKRSGKIIGICGCVAQKDGEGILKKLPFVSFVIGPRNIYKIKEAIDLAEKGIKSVFTEMDSRCTITDLSFPVKRDNPYRAYVTIMEGCNNFCTYCIVPFVRGRETSRPPEEIIEEIKKLRDEGYKEVTLLGQNVNSYGKDLGNTSFIDLLERISKIEGIEWIRFITSHPKDFSDELIDYIVANPKICEYIHLPAQSGSNRILNKMNRKYTRDRYLEIVEKLRNSGKYYALTSDFIVGFPGETEEDFEETLDLVNKAKYEGIFAFIYNPREFTVASQWEDSVPLEVKKERLKRLLKLQDSITEALSKSYIGKTVEVLFDSWVDGTLEGRTRTFKIVKARGDKSKLGYILKVRITNAKMYELEGEIVKEG